MDFKSQFQQVFRELRHQAGLTQEDIAKELGVTVKTIWRWDNGESLPITDQFFELINLLGEDMYTNLRNKTKEPNQDGI